jgi:hypothetical protein
VYTETAKEIEHVVDVRSFQNGSNMHCIHFDYCKQGKMVNVKEASTGNASRE